MEITIHEEKKMAISHFTGNKKRRPRVTKIPFTTLVKPYKAAALAKWEERQMDWGLEDHHEGQVELIESTGRIHVTCA